MILFGRSRYLSLLKVLFLTIAILAMIEMISWKHENGIENEETEKNVNLQGIERKQRWQFTKTRNGSHIKPRNEVNCQPATKILFLKTHKTASSTVTNILNRYGNRDGLVFALPAYGYSFRWPDHFKTTSIARLYEKPDILCNHARYNKRPMHFLFPKNYSRYITILRHPVSHYESIFMFFKLAKVLPIKGNSSIEILDKFLQSKHQFDGDPNILKTQLTARLLRNPMLFDLGMEHRYFQNPTAIIKYIEFLHREFDLVLMMEYFDESMVLLKRFLCWNLDDVIYLKLNERRDEDKTETIQRIKENIVTWNRGDMMLYKSFNDTFWAKIREEGPDFYAELEEFRARKKIVFEKCIQSKRAEDIAYRNHFVKGYVLKNVTGTDKEFCNDLIRNELDYMEVHKQRQKRRMEKINSVEDLG